MLRFFLNTLKFILVVTGAIFLSTLGINAADSWKNPENSMLAGALSSIAKPDKCSEGMVYVGTSEGGYCIDAYENSASESCAYDIPKNQPETRLNLSNTECIPVSVKGASPWRNISQSQAMQACAKAGKRLPTNEEWFFAALGTPDEPSSWGSSDCNVNKNSISEDLALTGSGGNCVSALGAYDMVGNVWEWMGDTIKSGKFGETEVPNSGYVTSADENGIPSETNATSSDPNYNLDRFWVKKEGVMGMFRGGYWLSRSDAGIYTIQAGIPPSFVGNAIGFRCVK
ncbi:MAG: SUMF1/EgtB/PvdO family nonheme iron enzyme [Candidatus Paceibacterota bacterium]|jgi:formylglycine-generating enzyme required for sulfatase activity|nr:SUMF1/EgtB/PvdO family nonheme iron enzyme [Candidatus Paceibacterota bacterium]